MSDIFVWLANHDCCRAGMTYLMRYETAQDAWNVCPDPEWMIWILAQVGNTEMCMRAATTIAEALGKNANKARRDCSIYGIFNTFDWLMLGHKPLSIQALADAIRKGVPEVPTPEMTPLKP